MSTELPSHLVQGLTLLRDALAVVFRPDTAVPGSGGETPSAGHCAAVAVIVRAEFGGDFVSANVHGQSHWFNRIYFESQLFDVDLTGDQFGFPSVRFGPSGSIFAEVRTRGERQLSSETLQRALVLARRANRFLAAEKIALFISGRT
ncbi:YunG family protein [Variovorax sp. IB41]|uniref:YunG family protein n=1 Tax=Variovorax sp. IB41 TaxID=2779370 RepID=UPI0018E84189|nr:hypothetical protein [Variovorax sp. IB41]MBJ2160265.1 hypothetical protein [Variovorax sp. IB41]